MRCLFGRPGTAACPVLILSADRPVGVTTTPYVSSGSEPAGTTYLLNPLAEHTLTLDGQSDTDSYEVYTLGSQDDEREAQPATSPSPPGRPVG